MVWFKVDDGLPEHRKVRRLPTTPVTVPTRVAAMGLWTFAGAWSSRNLMDGFVPAEIVQLFGDHSEHLAQRLVQVGLWEEAEEDGERGYLFHDWQDRQPLKEEVLETRAKRAESGRAGGLASGRARRAKAEATAEATASTGVRNGARRPSQSTSNGASNKASKREATVEALAEALGSRTTFPQVTASVPDRSNEAKREANDEANANQNRTPSRPVPTRPLHLHGDARNTIATTLGLNPDDDEDDETIEKILDLIIAENNVTAPSRYIQRLADNGDLPAYLARVRGTRPAAAYDGPTHPFQPSGSAYNPACTAPGCGLVKGNRVHTTAAAAA